jgi:hypothetical protein
MTGPRIICTLLAALVFESGCSSDSKPEEWFGQHLTYVSAPMHHTCGGTRPLLDNFVPFFAAELGLSLPTNLQYTWDRGQVDEQCGPLDNGCASGQNAFSLTPFLPHEVVHAVASTHGLNKWPFFSEGLAVAFDPWNGDSYGPRYVLVPNEEDPLPDPRESVTLTAQELHYFTAGSFVAFLLSRYGPEPLVAMLRQLGDDRDLDDLRAAFRASYSVEFDDEADLFMTGTSCPSDPFPVLVYDCTMPEVAWESPTRWHYQRVLDCEDDDVAGGYNPQESFPSVHSVTLDVAGGVYDLRVESAEKVVVQIGPCFGCPWDGRERGAASGEPGTIDLAAGPHYLRVIGQSDESPEIEVELSLP